MNFIEEKMIFEISNGKKNIQYPFELICKLAINDKDEDDKKQFENKIKEYKNGKNGKKYEKYVKSIEEYQDAFGKVKKISDVFCEFRLNKEAISKKFNLGNSNDVSGVYIWKINGEIVYIGETKTFIKRFNEGYGRITPRNIFAGGQNTNCRMNIVAKKNKNKIIEIYFCKTNKCKELESNLLKYNNENEKEFWLIYNVKNNKHRRSYKD